MKKLLLWPLLVLVSTYGCATTNPQGERDPAWEKEKLDRRKQLAKQRTAKRDVNALLLELNRLLENYYTARKAPNNREVDRFIGNLKKAISERTEKHFAELVVAAQDEERVQLRGVALTALGFSHSQQSDAALAPLTSALGDKDPNLVMNACLGLGELRDRRTPPSLLTSLVDDKTQQKGVRFSACWALTQLQPAYDNKTRLELVPFWVSIVRRNKVESEILVPSIRSLGLFRDPSHAKDIYRYTTHPDALVRISAGIALGRMGNQESSKVLLKMLGPNETNLNARLAARKALQALAGGADGKYDVARWQEIFERKK